MLFTEAMEVLADLSWQGDHDFAGEQMDAWQEQRGALLVGLAFVASDAPVPDDVWERITRARCPRTVVDEYITEENEVTHYTECRQCGESIEHETTEMEQVENPAYSNGTEDGAGWVDAARSVVERARRAEEDARTGARAS